MFQTIEILSRTFGLDCTLWQWLQAGDNSKLSEGKKQMLEKANLSRKRYSEVQRYEIKFQQFET